MMALHFIKGKTVVDFEWNIWRYQEIGQWFLCPIVIHKSTWEAKNQKGKINGNSESLRVYAGNLYFQNLPV